MRRSVRRGRALSFGLDVVAVEPLDSLREVLATKIGVGRVRNGVAESIPAEYESFGELTVGDSFHWLDPARALAEIARVPRASGGLAILAMVPDWSGASWAHELGTLSSARGLSTRTSTVCRGRRGACRPWMDAAARDPGHE